MRCAFAAILAAALSVPSRAAAPTDFFPQRVALPAPAPGRALPQHSFIFGGPAYWPQGLYWRYNNADAPGQFGEDDTRFMQRFADAAAKWTTVCGVSIVYDGPSSSLPAAFVNGAPDRVNVIGWQPPQGGVQAATLAWSDTAPSGDQVLVDADILLNPALVTTPEILASVLTHELGHAIGLGHSPVAFAMMSGPPDTAYSNLSDLTPDDVQGCRCLYGPPANVAEGYICSLPSKIDFESVTVGTRSVPRQVAVTNDGNASMTIGSIQLQGGGFVLTSDSCTFGMALAPRTSCAINISGAPGSAGFQRAEAILDTSSGPYRIPLSVLGIPVPPLPLNFEGAWRNAPAGSEDGWGLTLAHQNDVIFATWFTYDLSHRAMWLSMTAFRVGNSNTYSGTLYRTAGPPVGSEPFDSSQVQRFQVGPGALEFADADRGTFFYSVDGIAQARSITRLAFRALPTCTFDSPYNPVVSTNFQGNWWESSGTESGWGIYLTHQEDTIFASWFTYDLDGSPMWLSATAGRMPDGKYHGDIIRTTGAPFNTIPFPSQQVNRSTLGALTLSFANGNHATFAYSVTLGSPPSGISRTEQLTRLVLRHPGTLCQ